MLGHEGFTGDARRRLANHYEVAVRSLATLRGYFTLGDGQIGRIVDDAVAGASAEERRNPDQPLTSSFGRLEGLLRDAVEADRPRNIHSAEAARLEQLGAHGAAGLLGHKGYAELQQARRDAAREARDGVERGAGRSGERYGELPAAGDRVSSAVTSAYVQQYAGTGLGRGTVRISRRSACNAASTTPTARRVSAARTSATRPRPPRPWTGRTTGRSSTTCRARAGRSGLPSWRSTARRTRRSGRP